MPKGRIDYSLWVSVSPGIELTTERYGRLVRTVIVLSTDGPEKAVRRERWRQQMARKYPETQFVPPPQPIPPPSIKFNECYLYDCELPICAHIETTRAVEQLRR